MYTYVKTYVKTYQVVLSKYILSPNKVVLKGDSGIISPEVFMVSLTFLYSLRGCKFIHILIQKILIACQSYTKFYVWLLIKIENKGIESGK